MNCRYGRPTLKLYADFAYFSLYIFRMCVCVCVDKCVYEYNSAIKMAVLPLEFFDNMNEAGAHYAVWNKQDKLCIGSPLFGISKNWTHRNTEYIDNCRIWGEGNEIMVKEYRLPGISSGDLMYSMVTVVSSVEHLKVAEKISLKCSHHNNKKWYNSMRWRMC